MNDQEKMKADYEQGKKNATQLLCAILAGWMLEGAEVIEEIPRLAMAIQWLERWGAPSEQELTDELSEIVSGLLEYASEKKAKRGE